MEEWNVVFFTIWIAALSTAIILPFGVGLAWLLARRNWPGKSLVETMVSLPLVIPPVATGLILLKVFGRRGPVGKILEENLALEIVFTWKAVLLALAVMSFPLLVRTARAAFEEVDFRLEQVARTMGSGPFKVFRTISLPLARRGIIGGCILAFARALGEFGATILIAGAITGKTATISVSIYNLIQLGQDEAALVLMMVSIGISFVALWCGERFLRPAKP